MSVLAVGSSISDDFYSVYLIWGGGGGGGGGGGADKVICWNVNSILLDLCTRVYCPSFFRCRFIKNAYWALNFSQYSSHTPSFKAPLNIWLGDVDQESSLLNM